MGNYGHSAQGRRWCSTSKMCSMNTHVTEEHFSKIHSYQAISIGLSEFWKSAPQFSIRSYGHWTVNTEHPFNCFWLVRMDDWQLISGLIVFGLLETLGDNNTAYLVVVLTQTQSITTCNCRSSLCIRLSGNTLLLEKITNTPVQHNSFQGCV